MDRNILTKIIAQARSAQEQWARTPVRARARMLGRLADELQKNAANLQATMAREIGKPVRQGRQEIEKSMRVLRYFARRGPSLLQDETVPLSQGMGKIRFEPVGIATIFTPWNYPVWGIVRQIAPALLCGNACLIRPASQARRIARLLGQMAIDAGVPRGAVNVVCVPHESFEALIALADAVTVVGSPRLGSAVAALAGKHLKRINLQLSGSDPFIVLEDVDVRAVAKRAARSRLQNAGQDCVAAKRFIVRKEIEEEFASEFVKAMTRVRVGDPKDPTTEVGPLGNGKVFHALEEQVADARKQGARVLLGGKGRKQGRWYFYLPTVITNVAPAMRVWREETFGPVAAVRVVRSDEEAVRLANNSPFGLAASIWTIDTARAQRMAERLACGAVHINGQPGSTPVLPFGGVKQTGWGRDFSKYGLLHYVVTKSIVEMG